MKVPSLEQAYKQGSDAYFAGVAEWANPYKHRGQAFRMAYHEWADGWNDARMIGAVAEEAA